LDQRTNRFRFRRFFYIIDPKGGMATMFSEYFFLEDGYAAFRPKGRFTFEEAVGVIDEALAYCRDNEIRGLLVVISGMTGFAVPTTTQRFAFGSRWAETAAGRVALSMVAPAEMIDSEKLGVMVANNRGLQTDVFTSERDAIAWLKRSNTRHSPPPEEDANA
jgi:hypothetical protein